MSTKQPVFLREKLQNILNEKFSLASKLTDTDKVKKNSIVNDLPTLETVKNQDKIDPETTKSTHGLIGFENDKINLRESILLGQNQNEENFRQYILDQTFGKLQVNFDEAGGVQTKTLDVPHNIVNNFSQEEIAKMSAKDKLRFEEIIKKFTLKAGIEPIHQIKTDALVQTTGESNKKTISKNMGIRNMVENINSSMRTRINSIKKVREDKKTSQNVVRSNLEDLKQVDTMDQVSL